MTPVELDADGKLDELLALSADQVMMLETDRCGNLVSGPSARAGVAMMVCDDLDQEAIARVAHLVDHGLPAPLVVICDNADGHEIRSLVAAGASGVVRRGDVAAALGPTIEAVLAGQVCIPACNAPALKRPVLSIREKQIVGMLALGLTNREIADRLFVAECTVKSHLSSAFAKLGVRSRHEAIDLILDPAFGLGVGILTLEAEPLVGGATNPPAD